MFLNIFCAAMIASLCLFHQTLPLKSVKYGDCLVLLSITPPAVLQGSGTKQIDSDTAWPADHSSFMNTTTLNANPGKDAAILPPPHRPTTHRSHLTSGERPPATAHGGQSAIKGIRFHGLRRGDWGPPTHLQAINFTLSWQAEGADTRLPQPWRLPSPDLHMAVEGRVMKDKMVKKKAALAKQSWEW